MAMRYRLAFFSCALLIFGCSSTLLEKGEYPSRRPKFAIEVDKQGRKDGTELWWYPNGQIKYRALNHGGFRDGKFTSFYPSGMKWYEGYEYRGRPESTLTYWYPSGTMKSQALYRDGIQLERKDWEPDGRLQAVRILEVPPPAVIGPQESEQVDGADAAVKERQASLQVWAMRVRQAVESYWRLPKGFEREPPQKAVVTLRVGRDGSILKVTWNQKAPSPAFNALVMPTFGKIKRLPPFPASIAEESLDVQYEFVSLGKAAPRKRLEARGGPTDSEELVEPDLTH